MSVPVGRNNIIHCTICTEDITDTTTSNGRYTVVAPDDEVIFIEKCTHIFHQNCILPWVSRHDNCPNCRASDVRASLYKMNDFQSRYERFLNSEITKSDFHSTTNMTKLFSDVTPTPSFVMEGQRTGYVRDMEPRVIYVHGQHLSDHDRLMMEHYARFGIPYRVHYISYPVSIPREKNDDHIGFCLIGIFLIFVGIYFLKEPDYIESPNTKFQRQLGGISGIGAGIASICFGAHCYHSNK